MTPNTTDPDPGEAIVRERLSVLRADVVQGTVAFVERVRGRLVEVDRAAPPPSLVSIAADVVVELTNLVTGPLNTNTKKDNGG